MLTLKMLFILKIGLKNYIFKILAGFKKLQRKKINNINSKNLIF